MTNDNLEKWFENDRKERKKRFNSAVENTKKEFFPMQEEKIKKIYKSVIDDFYSDYYPRFYNRRDDGSLYNLLNCRSDTEHLYISFDPSKISYRNGYDGEDGLYKTVFQEGWHGGAKHNESMYWRKPVPYYTYWGREAIRADISPLDDFNKRFDDYQDTEFEDDFRSLFDKNLKKENL